MFLFSIYCKDFKSLCLFNTFLLFFNCVCKNTIKGGKIKYLPEVVKKDSDEVDVLYKWLNPVPSIFI